MNRVAKILMERDGITEQEAKEQIDACREEILAAVEDGYWYDAEDILADFLGLEPDYLIDII